jgi:hypothetical protein
MEQQTTLPGFKRKARVGFNIIGFESVGQVRYLKIQDTGTFTKKDGDQLEYADVIDLTTGEEARMWLDGALRYQINQVLDKKGGKFGFALEIRYDGKKEMEALVEGKWQTVMGNTYSMWELDDADTKSNN